jgi:hypothetical protein
MAKKTRKTMKVKTRAKQTRAKQTLAKPTEPLLSSGTQSGCTLQAYQQLIYPHTIHEPEFVDFFCAKKMKYVHWEKAAEAAAQLLGGVVATRDYATFRDCVEASDRIMGGILSIKGKRSVHHVVCFKNNKKSGFTIYDSARYHPYDVSLDGRASSALFEGSSPMVVLEFPSLPKNNAVKDAPEVHVID